jgi:hypothetical protein
LFAVVTESGAGTPAMNELTARVLRRLSEISSGKWLSLNPDHYYKLWVRFRNRIVATSGHRSPRKDLVDSGTQLITSLAQTHENLIQTVNTDILSSVKAETIIWIIIWS